MLFSGLFPVQSHGKSAILKTMLILVTKGVGCKMKRIKSLILALICLLAFASPILATSENGTVDINVLTTVTEENLNLEAQGAILMGLENGEIIFSRNGDKKLYPASTTKILTALLALEHGDLDGIVTVGNEANLCTYDSSKAGLDIGEEISLEELLYGLMLPSGNDAAYTIAVHIGREVKSDQSLSIDKAVDAFIDLMNSRSKELGASNSHFVTPDGYHDDNHYTTARDIALITREAMKHDVFRKIVATRMFTIPDWSSLHNPNVENETRYWRNSNLLIQPNDQFHYPDATGVKTGYTSKAMHCLVTSATRDNMELLTVVLGSSRHGKWTDSTTLLDYGFDNYERYKPFSQGEQLAILDIEGNPQQDWVRIVADRAPIFLIPKGNLDKVSQEIEWNEEVSQNEEDGKNHLSIEVPVSKSQKVGSVTISLDGKILDKIDLITSRAVEKKEKEAPKPLVKIKDGIDNSFSALWASHSPWKKVLYGLGILIIILFIIRIGLVRRRRKKQNFIRRY